MRCGQSVNACFRLSLDTHVIAAMLRKTLFEDLSNELLREVCRYLSIQEQFFTFHNLNQRIDRCILTNRCHWTLKGDDRTSEFFLRTVFPLLTSCDHISRLRIENVRRVSFFLLSLKIDRSKCFAGPILFRTASAAFSSITIVDVDQRLCQRRSCRPSSR